MKNEVYSVFFGLYESFSKRYQFAVLAGVTIARAIYSLNWYTLSPGLTQVGAGFHASLQSLGVVESAFLAGAGIFQVPVSYAVARWNAKSLMVLGLSVIALANGIAAFSPNLEVLVLLRFLLGVGAAMFFSPAIIVVTPLFRTERQGLTLGIYNAAFNVGGAVALLGWAYVVEAYSWRIGLLLGAVLAIPPIVILTIVIKHSEKALARKSMSAGKSVAIVFKNRQIWFLGMGIIGMWAASYAISQFLPYFVTSVNLLPGALAGLLASLILIVPIPGSVIGGWLSDRMRNRKAFLLYPTVVFGVGTALIGFSNFSESLMLLGLMGLVESFTFASMYASPFQMEDLSLEQKAMSISLMNSIQILGAFILPILFATVAADLGYTDAWIVAGAFTMVFVPFLLLFREPFKSQVIYRT